MGAAALPRNGGSPLGEGACAAGGGLWEGGGREEWGEGVVAEPLGLIGMTDVRSACLGVEVFSVQCGGGALCCLECATMQTGGPSGFRCGTILSLPNT